MTWRYVLVPDRASDGTLWRSDAEVRAEEFLAGGVHLSTFSSWAALVDHAKRHVAAVIEHVNLHGMSRMGVRTLSGKVRLVPGLRVSDDTGGIWMPAASEHYRNVSYKALYFDEPRSGSSTRVGIVLRFQQKRLKGSRTEKTKITWMSPWKLMPWERCRDRKNVAALAKRMKKEGWWDGLPPIFARDDDYEILDGHHRVEAALHAELDRVPVVLVPAGKYDRLLDEGGYPRDLAIEELTDWEYPTSWEGSRTKKPAASQATDDLVFVRFVRFGLGTIWSKPKRGDVSVPLWKPWHAEVTLEPRTPATRMGRESRTPRIAFARSIPGAIAALWPFWIPMFDSDRRMDLDAKWEIHVYRPTSAVRVVRPTRTPDAAITGEVWVLEPVRIRRTRVLGAGETERIISLLDRFRKERPGIARHMDQGDYLRWVSELAATLKRECSLVSKTGSQARVGKKAIRPATSAVLDAVRLANEVHHKGTQRVNERRKTGFESGSERTVWPLGDFVVKVSNHPRGCRQNQVEALVWKYAPRDLRPHLARVIAANPDGRWLVAEACEPLNSWGYEEGDVYGSRLPHLADKYGLDDLFQETDEDEELDPIHWSNLGLCAKGRLKIIDYGYTNLEHSWWWKRVPPKERLPDAERARYARIAGGRR
jgi:hypothetical protein